MSDWVIVPPRQEIDGRKSSNNRESLSSLSSYTWLQIDGKKSIGRELLLPGVDLSCMVLQVDGRKSLCRDLLLPTVDTDLQQQEDEKSSGITKTCLVNMVK